MDQKKILPNTESQRFKLFGARIDNGEPMYIDNIQGDDDDNEDLKMIRLRNVEEMTMNGEKRRHYESSG